ncbi:MAG: ATP-binding protein [Caldimonas sp.]
MVNAVQDPRRLEPAASPAALSSAPDTDLARLISEAAPVLIWSATESRRNDWLSPSWTAYTGRSADTMAGAGWTSSVHPEDVDRCLGIRAASFEAGAPFTMDLRLRRHDGEYRWMLDHGVPRFDAAGQPIGYVGTCVDIHERKELEESLAERTQQLRLAERRQGQFLAKLSHELRNPLAPIANAASVLRTLEQANPILVRLREILERQVGRLSHLIEELIDVTRAAQGQISLVREPLAIDSVVQAAVASAHDKLNAGGHRLEVDVPEERLFVRGDRARLSQALAHLIANAAKFSFEPGTITIAVRRVAKTVQIMVKDHGEGIDEAFLPHAFELFAQQDQTLARTLGGLGVGLTLARRIAQLHGGNVEAFSDGPGHGSEFVFWLPLAEGDGSTDLGSQTGPGLSESYRILIVEDDADALESLRLQMELWGNEVSTARDADAALAVAARVKPQIVLCDIGLPGTDGFRLVAQLRKVLEGLPVVFAAVTGYASQEDQQRALAAGYDSFFVKPLNPTALVNLLRAYAGSIA